MKQQESSSKYPKRNNAKKTKYQTYLGGRPQRRAPSPGTSALAEWPPSPGCSPLAGYSALAEYPPLAEHSPLPESSALAGMVGPAAPQGRSPGAPAAVAPPLH